MRNCIVAFIFIALGGCMFLIGGEGMFVVSGDVSSYAGKSCESKLLEENESPQITYSTRSVVGSFEVDYVVAPGSRTYIVEIVCSGQVVVSRRVRYKKDVGPGGIIELGTIK